MRSDRKSPALTTSISLFAAIGLCLGTVQVFAAPPTVTRNQKLSSPPTSFLDDPLLGPSSPYPFRDAYAYAPDGYPRNHAVLAVPQPSVRQVRRGAVPSNEIFAVDVCLYNDIGDTRSFYNLYWDPLIPMPGRLGLYDSQKRYVCDLLEKFGGSEKTIAASDWAEVPASGYVGKILYVSLPYPSYIVTPPGKYYLQVIYLPRLLLFPSESNSSAFNYDEHTELFRSNAVPITVVDQPAVKAPKIPVPSKP